LSTPLDSSIAPSRTRTWRCDSPRSACPLWDLPMLAAALTAVHVFQRWRTVPLYRHLRLHLQAGKAQRKAPTAAEHPSLVIYEVSSVLLGAETFKKLLRLSAFPGASPKQPWYRRPGWPLRSIYIVSRQSLYLLDPPSAHIPSSEKPGIELPTDA